MKSTDGVTRQRASLNHLSPLSFQVSVINLRILQFQLCLENDLLNLVHYILQII